MKKIFYFFIAAIIIRGITACSKPDEPKIIPDVTGVWETDKTEIPGFICAFRENGEYCELEKTITAWPDCNSTWYQSNDSVFTVGSINRLLIVEQETDTSFFAIVVDQCGDHIKTLRFVQ